MKIKKAKVIKLSSTDGIFTKLSRPLRLPKKDYYESRDLAVSLLMMKVKG